MSNLHAQLTDEQVYSHGYLDGYYNRVPCEHAKLGLVYRQGLYKGIKDKWGRKDHSEVRFINA